MASLGFDNWLEDVQAKHEHWHDQPRCEYCGRSLRGFYAYDTPDGLYCEECMEDLLDEYRRDWRVDADDWREIDE